jgi:hypothetical protein
MSASLSFANSPHLALARVKTFCRNLYNRLFLASLVDGKNRRDDLYIDAIVNMLDQDAKFKSRVNTEKIGHLYGIKDAQMIKELTEYAIIKAAKKVMYNSILKFKSKEDTFWQIVNLYENQPYSTYRSTETQQLQQYSTPIPMAYLMDLFVMEAKPPIANPIPKSAKKVSSGQGYKAFKGIGKSSVLQDYEVTFSNAPNETVTVYGEDKAKAFELAIKRAKDHLEMKELRKPKKYLEPTAGNGMLVFAIPNKELTVNEIDITRLGILYKQEFAEVKNLDASLPMGFEPESFDGVIANPPFGVTKEPLVMYGWALKGLEARIIAQSLEYLKPHGRAAFIVGGHVEFEDTGKIAGVKDYRFLNFLAYYYNLIDVINIEGGLYYKQGTQIPIRILLIDGKKETPEGYYPLNNKELSVGQPFSPTVVKTWAQLLERFNNNGYIS